MLQSFPYGQNPGPVPAPAQPFSSVTGQRYRSAMASDYGPPYVPVVSASPVLGLFPGSSLMTSEGNSDPGAGSSSNRHTASELGRHSSSSVQDWDMPAQTSPERYYFEGDISGSPTSSEFHGEPGGRRQTSSFKHSGKQYGQRRPSNRDEFDGPHQLLDKPSPDTLTAQDRELPHLPTNLFVQEQDEILSQVNERLSLCAFHFVAKYQFPIPLEPDKRPVSTPADREWTEWVYLLKRLATKRRIPARVLYNGQIKQLVTVLENSMEMRHAAKHQSRPLKDDRNVLQLISAGIQVTKILKDASAMEFMDRLYVQTENLIQSRKHAQLMPSNRK